MLENRLFPQVEREADEYIVSHDRGNHSVGLCPSIGLFWTKRTRRNRRIDRQAAVTDVFIAGLPETPILSPAIFSHRLNIPFSDHVYRLSSTTNNCSCSNGRDATENSECRIAVARVSQWGHNRNMRGKQILFGYFLRRLTNYPKFNYLTNGDFQKHGVLLFESFRI